MIFWIFALTCQMSPSCVYLRASVIEPSPCVGRLAMARPARPSAVGRPCEAGLLSVGLPPDAKLRLLLSGGVCAGAELFEPVVLDQTQGRDEAADLPSGR